MEIEKNLVQRRTVVIGGTAALVAAHTLPAQAQAGIATAIAAISGNPTGVVNIAGALNSGDITPAAEPQLEQALTLASGAMFIGGHAVTAELEVSVDAAVDREEALRVPG